MATGWAAGRRVKRQSRTSRDSLAFGKELRSVGDQLRTGGARLRASTRGAVEAQCDSAGRIGDHRSGLRTRGGAGAHEVSSRAGSIELSTMTRLALYTRRPGAPAR